MTDMEMTGDSVTEDEEGAEPRTVSDTSATPDLVTQLTKELSAAKEELQAALKRAEKADRQYQRTLAYNEDLRQQVDVLSRELHQYKTRSRLLTDQSTQTLIGICTQTSAQGSDPANHSRLPQSTEDRDVSQTNQQQETSTEATGVSLAESLRATAEAALQDTGFVFDENTGLYYDSTSGYFYDNENSLYFDPPSGTYFYYDEPSGEYKFHSQVDMTGYFANQSNGATGLHDAYSSAGYTGSLPSEDSGLTNQTAKNKHKRDRSKREKKKDKHGISKKAKRKRRDEASSEGQQEEEQMEVDKDEEMEMSDMTNDKKLTSRSGEKLGAKTLKCDRIKNAGDPKTGPVDNSEGQEQDDTDQDTDSESELESGELTESELSSLDSSPEEDCVESFEPAEAVDESNPNNWPPCIRVMVTESDTVDPGSLFVVTYPGGSIGREGSHVILLPEVNVSKVHAEITYCEPDRNYVIVDRGSQNGTYVNGSRIAEPKCRSEPHVLSHGDVLGVGSSSLLCHIHAGLDTCDLCEPGQVLADLQAQNQPEKDVIILSKEEKEKLRRRQLKEIKRKYGLANMAYVENTSAIKNPSYSDKAEERRKTVGSDNPYQKSEAPSSVHKPISTVNKGHKMLQKMGWSEGESLGKDNSGICEPVKVSFRLNKNAGLGSSLARPTDLDNAYSTRSSQIWIKTQQRFNELTGDPADQKSTENSNESLTKKPAAKQMSWVQGETLDLGEDTNSASNSSGSQAGS